MGEEFNPRISELTTVALVCEGIDVKKPTVHYHINRGTIRSIRLGKTILILKKDVEDQWGVKL